MYWIFFYSHILKLVFFLNFSKLNCCDKNYSLAYSRLPSCLHFVRQSSLLDKTVWYSSIFFGNTKLLFNHHCTLVQWGNSPSRLFIFVISFAQSLTQVYQKQKVHLESQQISVSTDVYIFQVSACFLPNIDWNYQLWLQFLH